MSLKKFSISFLKEHEIRYFINNNNEYASFECLICYKKANLHLETTKWECSYCKTVGDIESLIKLCETKLKQHERTIEIFYNPRKEKNEVNYHLKKLILKSKGTEFEKELLKIQNKIERLLEELIPKRAT